MTPKRTTPEAIARHALAACTCATHDATFDAATPHRGYALHEAGLPYGVPDLDWMRQVWIDSYTSPTRVTMEARR